MKPSPASVMRDAWALARRDGGVLVPVAGLFWFLPAYALLLLRPRMPLLPPGADAQTQAATLTPWLEAVAPWYLLVLAIGLWGTTSVCALYLDRERPTVVAALRRGVSLWPRMALAQAAIGIVALPPALLMSGMAGGAGLLLCLPAFAYLLGRTLPVGPALAGERRLGALPAIARAIRLTHGRGLALAGVVAAIWGAGQLVHEPLMAVDRWLRGLDGGNPVALAIVDAAVAGVSAAVALTATLAAVTAYRRLAR